jgi:hypothetical protein
MELTGPAALLIVVKLMVYAGQLPLKRSLATRQANGRAIQTAYSRTQDKDQGYVGWPLIVPSNSSGRHYRLEQRCRNAMRILSQRSLSRQTSQPSELFFGEEEGRWPLRPLLLLGRAGKNGPRHYACRKYSVLLGHC